MSKLWGGIQAKELSAVVPAMRSQLYIYGTCVSCLSISCTIYFAGQPT